MGCVYVCVCCTQFGPGRDFWKLCFLKEVNYNNTCNNNKKKNPVSGPRFEREHLENLNEKSTIIIIIKIESADDDKQIMSLPLAPPYDRNPKMRGYAIVI